MFGSTGVLGGGYDAVNSKMILGVEICILVMLTAVLVSSILSCNVMYDNGHDAGLMEGHEEGIEYMKMEAVRMNSAEWLVDEERNVTFKWHEELIFGKEGE